MQKTAGAPRRSSSSALEPSSSSSAGGGFGKGFMGLKSFEHQIASATPGRLAMNSWPASVEKTSQSGAPPEASLFSQRDF
eukprot:12416443-Alexandrium_andersonii.AAC.1